LKKRDEIVEMGRQRLRYNLSKQTALLETPPVEGIGAMMSCCNGQWVIISCLSPLRSCGIRTTAAHYRASVSPDNSKWYRYTSEG